MPITHPSMSLESSSAAAIPSKTFPCSHSPGPPPPLSLPLPHRRRGGRRLLTVLKNRTPLLTQSRNPLRLLRLSSSPHNSTTDGQLDPESAAQEALSEYLHGELGLSEEEARSIVFGAPKYLKTLIEGVEELNELPELMAELPYWKADNYSSAPDGVGGGHGFKEKVVYMAKQKGVGGKVAFLESVGLSLPSATYIARLLSSETLPALIHKVKFVKEMLFSGRDEHGNVGKNARRLMMHLSIPVDDDMQQTLSFFEKIEAKRGGLDMLGDEDAAFRYLIESFPRLLLLSIESHLKPLLGFLEKSGIPSGRIRSVLFLFPPIIFHDVKRLEMKLMVFEKVAAAEDIGRLLTRYPWILSTGIQENYKEIISFFEMEKVPRVSVDRAIRSWPHLLGCTKTKLKSIIECFGELGVRNKMLGKVIAKSPQLLLRKPDGFLQVVLLLEDVGFDRETVGKILVRCPEIFAASIEKTLKKKLDFLMNIGISECHLPRVIKKYPEVLVSDIDNTLLPRMNYLMEIGLSKREVASMVRRFSPLLGYSIDEVFRPKVDFLVNTMEKPLKEVVEYPRYFSYSLEKKIKPRHWVLKGMGFECSLKDALSKNDEEFAAEFMGVGR